MISVHQRFIREICVPFLKNLGLTNARLANIRG